MYKFVVVVSLDVTLDDVSNITNPMDKVVAGLQSNGDVQIPLKSVHVRAKLQDLTSEVRFNVYLHYRVLQFAIS